MAAIASRICALEDTLAFVQRELSALKLLKTTGNGGVAMAMDTTRRLFCFWDTETNGLGKTDALRIIQLGAIMCNDQFEELGSFNEFISPGREPIDQGATAVNGISETFAKTHPMFDEVGPRFHGWIDSFESDDKLIHFIAHNGKRFDTRILYFEHARHRLVMPNNWCFTDSLQIFRDLYPDYKSYKLGKLYSGEFGEEIPDAHTALADAEAIRRLCTKHDPKMVTDKILKFKESRDAVAKRCTK